MKLTNRKYGVEIEFLGSTNEIHVIVDALQAAGINAQNSGYTHATTPYWKVLQDVSAGLEVVSPVLEGEDGFKQIETVCKVLNTLGRKVDQTCGLHVHHDMRGSTEAQIKKVFAYFIKWESVFNMLMPPSRRANRYCKAVARGNDVNYELAMFARLGLDYGHITHDPNARYHKLNYEAYLRHGTLEFRQMNGTTDAEKIISWIIVTQNVIERSIGAPQVKKASVKQISFKRLRDDLGCTGMFIEDNDYVKRSAKWLLTRWNKFSKFGVYESLTLSLTEGAI